MTHTPEPWLVGQPHGHHIYVNAIPFMTERCRLSPAQLAHPGGCNSCISDNSCMEAKYYGGEMVAESLRPADALRVVLAVNSVKGISNEALGEGVIEQTALILRDVFLYLDTLDDPEARRYVMTIAALMSAHGMSMPLGVIGAHGRLQ
ncbi:MAG: hypothetical protein ACSLE9_09110 [Burkholderiaceae bacterium]